MENNKIFTTRSSLNSDKSIVACLIDNNTIKNSLSNELEQNQKNNYRKISDEHNQFQLFRLDTNKLRQIFLDNG